MIINAKILHLVYYVIKLHNFYMCQKKFRNLNVI